MSVDISLVISIVSICFAGFFGFTTYRRNNTKDTEESVEERATMNARVLTKLDGISDNIKDIQRKIESTQTDVQQLRDRVIVCEEKIKTIEER